jgi:uncharacterized protein (TIGR03382 family)
MPIVREISAHSLPGLRTLLAGLALAALTSTVQAQLYEFTISPPQSGLNATLSVNVPTTGTMIGDWNAAKNPTGTRTKPGLFGTFGPTENVAVPTSVTLGISGPVNSRASGGFQISIDPLNATAQMSGYSANFLDSGPVLLPINLGLLYESFRTRSPDSTFPGGIPLQLPFGEASLTQLSISQVGGGVGTLKQTGPGQYDFFITPIVELTAEVVALGNPFLIPGAPIAFPLEGVLTVTGTSAMISSLRPVSFDQQQAVNQALPQLPFALPTVLPSGGTANLLMDLTVGTVTASLEGTSTINATGILIPSPGTLGLLGLGAAAGLRRRRR